MSNSPEVTLQRALVAVYPLYAERIVIPFGVELDAAYVAQGQAWLAAELEALLTLPYPEQARGPFELFQEATRFIGDGLAASGAKAPDRPPTDDEALPGDRFGIAPISTRELGRTVWEAHLRWGAAKAMALRDHESLGG